jgi:hypothetical protein
MKVSLTLLLTSALIFGAASLALGDTAKNSNSSHKSRSSTHHHSSGSHHSGTNSGSKTRSNVPSN